jgi:linoleoyl-CoA desaturase
MRVPQSDDLPVAPETGAVDHAVPGRRLGDDTANARRPKFPKDDHGFQADLEQRVATFFQETGRGRRDCWQMFLKTAIVLAWFAASYILLVFFAQTWWQALPLAVSLALALAAIGFNIQHDGGHQAYSRRPWMNQLAAMSLDLMGASSYLWHWKHVIFHHTYVNVTGVDTDIELGGAVRLTPHQRWRPAHRWQHLYLFPLYGIMAARWHLYGDFKDVLTGRLGPHRIPRPKGRDLIVFIGGKVVSIGLLLGLPLLWHPWWVVGLFYLVVTGVLGMVLSIVFQLAHCVEEADFPVPAADTHRLATPWAVHQARTTVDFARRSRVLAWYLGGLNFQIEHHLFPRVCHVHYPAIAPIVEATCKEYGVRYSVHPTFLAGIWSHYRWLWRMGHADRVGGRPTG